MTRPPFPISFQVFLTIVALLIVSTALADPAQRPPSGATEDKPEKGAGPDANEEIRREAEKVVGEIELEILSDHKWTKVERIEKALLFYGDHTRNNDRGSVWGWGRSGRPIALLELWQSMSDRTRWFYTICNTSGGKLRGKRAGAAWWGENDSAAELKDIPAAPAPAAEALQRQRQLKLLAQKFAGHEFWDPNNSRFELRRLERPLHTYRNEADGILEGGLFTLANGTNPEILVFLEARADLKGKSKAAWQYTVGRLADAELHLEYDGKEVFSAPRGKHVSGRDKPYSVGSIVKPPVIERDKK